MVWCVDEPLDRLLKQVEKRWGKTFELCGGVHDLLLYETPKVSRIRDAKLGLFYYLLVIAIIVYLVIQLGRNMEFLEQAVPSQSVRLEFNEPARSKQGQACNEPLDDPDCKEAFRDIRDIPYCCTEKCTPFPLTAESSTCKCPEIPEIDAYQCRLMDAISSAQITSQSIFIKTYRKYIDQQRNPDKQNCDIDHGRCEEIWLNHGKSKELFTADIERFRLVIDHSITLEAFGISGNVREMEGYLQVGAKGSSTLRHHRLCREQDSAVDDVYGGKLTNEAPCFIKPMYHREGDMFEVGVLLQAMSVSLDDAAEGSVPFRKKGLTVNVEVVYFNTRRFHLPLSKVHYFYKLWPEKRKQHDIEDIFVDNQDNEEDPSLFKRRTVEVSRGIFLTVTRGGFLAQFSFQHLLVTLTTGLALLAVATYIVTWVARFLLRWGNYYTELIYDTSGSFLHMEDIDKLSDADIDKALAGRNLEITGSREERVMRLMRSGWTLQAHSEGELSPLVQMDKAAPGQNKKGSSSSSSYGSRESPLPSESRV